MWREWLRSSGQNSGSRWAELGRNYYKLSSQQMQGKKKAFRISSTSTSDENLSAKMQPTHSIFPDDVHPAPPSIDWLIRFSWILRVPKFHLSYIPESLTSLVGVWVRLSMCSLEYWVLVACRAARIYTQRPYHQFWSCEKLMQWRCITCNRTIQSCCSFFQT